MTEPFFQKLFIMELVPVIIFVVSVIVWLIVALFKRSSLVMKREFVTTLTVLIFLVHPNIVRIMFSCFSCMEIDNKYWLYEDLTIQCWEGDHTKAALYVALPGVAIWGLGIPLIALIVLIKFRPILNTV
jgi:hypothetical protein